MRSFVCLLKIIRYDRDRPADVRFSDNILVMLKYFSLINSGNTEMQNQVDFAKSTMNSEINLKHILFPLYMYFLIQIIIRNIILNHDI